MKNNDVIKPFGKSLFVSFGTTGESHRSNIIRLDQGVSVFRSDNSLYYRYSNSSDACVLESFPNEALAITACSNVRSAMNRYASTQRLEGFGKGAVKWIGGPLVAGVFVLALNMAATRALNLPSPAASQSLNNQPIVMGSSSPRPSQAYIPSTALPQANGIQLPNQADPAELSKAVTAGIKAGKYSVQISSGTKGVLYVFSDPSCPHCRDLEPELDQLARDYTIHLFPVSVIGGESSTHRAAKMLCAKPEERAALWKKIVKGDDLETEECDEGSAAIKANDLVFRHMNFLGTPTIVNEAGEQTPLSLPNKASSIDQWMNQASQAK
ncbi:DsbC family protein [Pseudomonas asuensis]|uniref:Thiol:disulfide interchange protein n=1 Tax=Pseudomonas asuensis TaxID=1825787 RepID=A0ABQ2H179_9PSED|nr:DsbC family protein [Pseudomonas asuensis]GGM25581.1 hypothetical protein GCM10009425_40410 [Pseudomonas asuensis]